MRINRGLLYIIKIKRNPQPVIFAGFMFFKRTETDPAGRNILYDYILLFPVTGKINAFTQNFREFSVMSSAFKRDAEQLITTAPYFKFPFSCFLVMPH